MIFNRATRKILLIFIGILLGLVSAILIENIFIDSLSAKVASENNLIVTVSNPSSTNIEEKGQQFYYQGYYQEAIQYWQEAQQTYNIAGNNLAQARVLSNLALAYYQIGNWEEANRAITASYDLVSREKSQEVQQVLAQIFNNQGILQLALGDTEKAIASWQKSTTLYESMGDKSGIIRSAINQASGFKSLGFYRRALKSLAKVATDLQTQPDSLLKSVGLRNYGDILRLTGSLHEAQSVLETNLAIASKLNLPQEQVKTLLALGNVIAVKANSDEEIGTGKALELYQQALNLCQNTDNCRVTDLSLQVNLAQLNLLLTTDYWWRVDDLIPEIFADFNLLSRNFSTSPIPRDLIYAKISFAHSLLKLRSLEQISGLDRSLELKHTPSWSEIEALVTDAIAQSQQFQDSRLESYSLGLDGQIKERLEQWELASSLTQQALKIAQMIDAPEISYLWEWQLGRINQAQGNREEAIDNYAHAISILESLSQDLVTVDPNIQYSFRESVEPVYRQSLALLLTSDSNQTVSQENLQLARNNIESLQLAELHNFFREACLDSQPVEIDRIDSHAAAIYPIILRDRLEVIVSLPKQPLIHYSTPISRENLEKTIEELRQAIVVRSRRSYYEPAAQLYNYLIRPVIDKLEKNAIETLIFVPDGIFRNIPLATLYDGKQYLIEKYNVVLNPGLQLLNPRPLKEVPLKTLAVGITQARQGFAPLDFVNLELKEIQSKVDSIVLMDDKFTINTFQEEIQFSDYPIVHIATHGQFSSSLEDTFLLTWDNRIKINQLDTILQTRTPSKERAIELLVLSACETATGDKWAALGLAGMAVRAGARSTMATLWSVNDQATAELMSQFYEEIITNHQGKAQAVRNAQLTLLKNPAYQHPFYWASYVLVGNWL